MNYCVCLHVSFFSFLLYDSYSSGTLYGASGFWWTNFCCYWTFLTILAILSYLSWIYQIYPKNTDFLPEKLKPSYIQIAPPPYSASLVYYGIVFVMFFVHDCIVLFCSKGCHGNHERWFTEEPWSENSFQCRKLFSVYSSIMNFFTKVSSVRHRLWFLLYS